MRGSLRGKVFAAAEPDFKLDACRFRLKQPRRIAQVGLKIDRKRWQRLRDQTPVFLP